MPSKAKTTKRMTKPAVVSLFSGIGGLELGCAANGRPTALTCELETHAHEVLKAQFPNADHHRDVKHITLDDLPSRADTITAGFPCQDLSQAGQMAGLQGKRSSLVSHVFRLAKAPQIKHVILENVPFMLKLDQGAAMRSLARRLNTHGFMWAYRVIDSRAFGLAQRRRRVFLVASREFDPSHRLFQDDCGTPAVLTEPSQYVGFYWTEGNTGIGWTENAIPTLKVGSAMGIPSPPAIWRKKQDDIVTPGIQDAEALQGFTRGWTRAARSNQSDRYRWRLVGNAVSVDSAIWAARMLDTKDQELTLPSSLLHTQSGWPTAGFGGPGKKTRTVDVSEFPEFRTQSLGRFIRAPKPLSERATAGFRSRYLRSKLKKREAFMNALTQHLGVMRSEPSMA